MDDTENGFNDLMEGVRGRDDAAWNILVADNGPCIDGEVRRVLHRDLRARVDVADVVQDTWLEVLGQLAHETFADAAALTTYLRVLAHHTACRANRWHDRQRRAVARDQPVACGSSPDDGGLVDPAAGPLQVAVAHEIRLRIMDGCSARERRILRLIWKGYTHGEAAEIVGVSEKTVGRVLCRAGRRVPA